MRVVAALGGNALSPSSGTGTVQELRQALATTSGFLADLVQRQVGLVITHGNGPQVGRILLQQELAAHEVPPMPMDVCGAQSQGQVGYLLAQSLDSELSRRGVPVRALCMLTQVVVDGRDPAFRRPTKPVGPFYDRDSAHRIATATGYVFQEVAAGRWRRVVASPRPVRFVEGEPLRQVVDAGHVVVASGGGGVPVVENGPELRGVEAVVDKDLSAARLALLVAADLLLILTEVERVQLHYGRAHPRELDRMTVAQARELIAAGEFPEGSMGPKVAACCEFVEGGGARAVIASLQQAAEAAFGSAGTEVVAA